MRLPLTLSLLFTIACAPALDASSRSSPLGTATGGPHFVSTVTPWRGGDRVFVQAWDGPHHRVAINERAADGFFQGTWARESGAELFCLTCKVPDTARTHRAIMDVFPDGNHVVLSVEQSVHPGKIGDMVAEAGKGIFNDLWIARSDGSASWQLTHQPSDASHGIIWPRLNPQGTQLVWTEMYRPANLWNAKTLLGTWRIRLADVIWASGVPSLSNVRTYEPEVGNFYETYGFSPDGTELLFASSAFMPGVSDTQIYRVSAKSFSGLTRLSNQATPGWSNYNEFAFYINDGAQIIFARTRDSTAGGLDYWIMNADGSNQQRLTYLNEPWNAQSAGYTNLGGWALDPADPAHLLAGACSDLTCEKGQVVSIRLATTPVGPGSGLAAEYFSDPWLWNRVLTRVDASIGFNWGTGSPAPRMPADNFSVRWKGALQPYATGTYQICTYTDDGARLWVDDRKVIDAWYAQNGVRHCAAVQLDAARKHTVVMEVYEGLGSATAKLAWRPPGATAEEIIPAAQLY